MPADLGGAIYCWRWCGMPDGWSRNVNSYNWSGRTHSSTKAFSPFTSLRFGKILDEGNEGPRSIETVSRSGYRFRKDGDAPPDRGTIRGSHQPAHSGPARASIAILPFVNLSADPDNEYFSDGLTEEIINRLARFPGLKVIARTSAFAFKNAQQDVRRIAGALGVAHVLEGSVRKSGRRIRVSAQLIRASDGGHIWARRFDREIADVFEMQDVIADAIATTLHGELVTAPIIQRYTPDVPTYEAFLQGVHHLNKMTPQSMVRARECLEKAIACDARFAAAHCVLATYFIVLAANSHQPATEVMPLARAAANRALDIDPSVAEAHGVLGEVAALLDFDWDEAERRQRLAMACVPVSPRVRIGYARHLMLTGRSLEAVEEATRTLEEDPLDLLGRLFLAHCLQAAGNEAAASAQIRQVLELDESFWLAHLLHGVNQAVQRLYADALVSAEKAYALAPWNLRVIGLLAGMLTRTGTLGAKQVDNSHRIPLADGLLRPPSRQPATFRNG